MILNDFDATITVKFTAFKDLKNEMTCFIRVLNSTDFGGKLSLIILSKLTILDAVNKLIFIKIKKHQIGVNRH